MVKTSKQAKEKKEAIKRIVKLGEEYPIIGILNMHTLPAAQLARMKKQLTGKVEMIMSRKRLIKIALDKLKEKKQGIGKIEEYLKGMPALLFTKENPFTLFRIIKKAKSKAPAKPGQEAPFDIIIPAGPTPFAPGPVISELAGLGIPAGVEQGKVAVKKDTTVCKEGQPIKIELAGLLARLGVEPMEIGLDLAAVYEDGTIYPKSVLDVDEEQFMQNLVQAASWAVNLSVEAGYPTAETAELMIANAHRGAKAVAKEANVMTSETAEEMVEKAERELIALKESLPEMHSEPEKQGPSKPEKEETKPEPTPEPKVEEKKEEKKEEEKKEEPKEGKKEEPKKEEKKDAEKKEKSEQTNKQDNDKPIVDASIRQITDDNAHEKAEELVKDLMKKGTLRK